MAVANLTDVSAALGRPIDDGYEISQVNAWIRGAELMIQSRLGDIYSLPSETVRYVVAECVSRRVRNPEGKQNERIDDYSFGLAKEAAKAGLFITDEEWQMLTPDSAFKPSSFSVATGGAVGAPDPRGWWLE